MMTLYKNALLALLLTLSIPFLNGCKELEESNLETPETAQPDAPETTPDEPSFEPIQINAAPNDLTGFPGQTVTFTVTATSAGALSYQWYQDDVAIDDATEESLSFAITGTEDSGVYSIQISNISTSVTSSARLTVRELPQIIAEPNDVSIYPGDTATFEVSASGDDVQFEWQTRGLSGWSTLEEETSESLVIESVDATTNTQYRVKVKNRGGEKSSRTSRINFKTPIRINSQPSSQLVAEGDNATFSVTASGHGSLSYQWYKAGAQLNNSSTILGSTTPSLAINNVSASDASLYHVVVTNTDGRSTTSNSAELSVQGPAIVTVHPNSTTLYSGEAGSLVIAASGDNPITYQWQKLNSGNWQNISGATSSRLNFSSANSSTAGQYRCAITNNVSSDTSNAATITVLQSVSISQSPSSQTAQTGDSVEFSVSATGDGLQYEWTKDGQVIPINTPSLSFAAVRELDEATYGCRVYNDGGSASCASFSLNIQTPVAITTQPSPQSTSEGGSVSLSVIASGDPSPTVDWYFNGSVVGSNNTLTINSISLEQAGEYLCRVTNDISTIDCEPVTISVSQSAQITNQPTSSTVDEGGNLALSVVASGDSLNYDWIKDGTSLGINNTTLALTDLQTEDAGTYSCRVWNEHSSDSCANFSISVNGRISIISQPVAATAFEDESVTLEVAHNGGSDARVEWYFNDTLISSNSSTLTLNPISLAQAGEYRCVASNTVNAEACNAVTVTVLEKVRITKQPSSQMLSTGDTFILDIESSGEGPLLYQCYHNNSLILTTTDASSLVISDVSADDEGNYHCTVSNDGSTETSSIAALSVLAIEARRVMVTWDAPSSRADDTMLDPLEISGYSVHICPEGETEFETVATTTGTLTESVVELTPGSYTLTVTTLDINGLESIMSTEHRFIVE